MFEKIFVDDVSLDLIDPFAAVKCDCAIHEPVEPPPLHRRHAEELLFLQGGCLWKFAEVDGLEIVVQQEMEKRLPPAVIHLVDDRAEIPAVLHSPFAHVNNEEAPFLQSGGDHPVAIR